LTAQYAFYLDADSCTGCGTCAMACKDKNNLPAGLLWRRLCETEAGGFKKQGNGLTHDFYAFYISMSCNHCQNPPCTQTCPTGALEKRKEDGLVTLDSEICISCGECVPSCPYRALHIDNNTGKAGKCDGCPDLLSLGELPACVAACPMRVLDFGPLEQLHGKYPAAVTYDAIVPSYREILPCMLIKPHRRRG
jgi:anaerobic dimethyl sulfoxide reductase subunit B